MRTARATSRNTVVGDELTLPKSDKARACYGIMGAVLISIVMAGLYFTHVTKVQADIVTSQAGKCIDNMVFESPMFLVPEQYRLMAAQHIQYVPSEDMKKQDERVEKSNKQLQTNSMFAFVILFLIGLCCVPGLYKDASGPYVAKTHAATLVLVTCTYLVFVHSVVKRVILMDSNYVLYSISKSVEKCAKGRDPQVAVEETLA